MNQKIDNYINDVRHAVTVAGLNYEIWWTYVEKESRAKYVDAMNRYSLFFQTSIHAHFVALVIALYRLYEANDRTVNVPRLLKIIGENIHSMRPRNRGLRNWRIRRSLYSKRMRF
jgi:hypothetical protein